SENVNMSVRWKTLMTLYVEVENLHFIAPGAIRTGKYASTPKLFWQKNDKVAFWNQLQKAVDLHFNTIDRMAASEPGQLYDSLLSYSLSEHQGHSKNLSHRVRALPEQMQNYVTSMSRRQYPVLMEPRGQCGFGATQERRPVLLLAIKTSVHNYKKRQAIRKSWGRADWVWAQRGRGERRGAYVHRIFLLGTERSPELRDIFSEMLHYENQQYGDILQWDIDTCGHVSFVFEGDDEVFVNTPAMVSLLQEQLQRPPANSSLQDFMMGHMVYGGQPNRNSDSQEFIPESFYRGWYPSYARGTGRLSSALLLRRLLQVSHRVHLFPIEQVYVGMCLIRLNLSPSHHPAFLPSNWTKEREKQPCAVHRVLLLQTHSPTHMLHLWDSLNTNTGLCSNCFFIEI
uniref:Hexosyltransferase n=1 Tax=Neogobius melanostomus TaxID=47308 RepID=A0A8C6WIE3_9GOBI